MPRSPVRLVMLLSAASGIAAGLATSRAAAAPTTAPSATTLPDGATTRPDDLAATVQRLLDALDAPDPQEREDATVRLERLPPDALPLIERAINDGELRPEVVVRLRSRIPLLQRKAVVNAYGSRMREVAAFLKQSVAEYDRAGRTNPKWDQAARTALTDWAAAAAAGHPKREMLRPQASCRKAIALGCDDPMVRYAQVHCDAAVAAIPATVLWQRVRWAVDDLCASNYPDWRKAAAIVYRARLACVARHTVAHPDLLPDHIREDLDKAMALYLKALPASDMPELLRYDCIESIFMGYADMLDSAQSAVERVRPLLRASCKSPASIDLFEGRFALWRVQFGKPAMKEDEVQSMLEQAKQHLQAAADANPADPRAPTDMVRLADRANWERAQMEPWFERAMKANPSNYEACNAKLYFLEHHAQHDDLLAFGRECVAGGDYQWFLPIMLVDAHMFIGDFHYHQRENAYLARADVWAEVGSVYVEYLKRYPADHVTRSFYANLCARTAHWEEAAAQMRLLGDNAVPDRFNGPSDFDYLKRRIAAHAAAAATTTTTAPTDAAR